jgi:uncharacterized protein YecT (DUF1311 family)
MKKALQFLALALFACTTNAENTATQKKIMEPTLLLIYLESDSPSETYNSIIEAQSLWMRSAEKDCSTLYLEIGSSSTRNALYESCMQNQYSTRKNYLSAFVCGAGVQSGEDCNATNDAVGYIESGSKNPREFIARLHGFIFKNSKLHKERTIATLNDFTAKILISEPLKTEKDAAMLNDLGYAMSESNLLSGAYLILSEVEKAAPNRIVLKINIADTLWEMNQKKKATEYYRQYISAMKSAGKSSSIPDRAVARSNQ